MVSGGGGLIDEVNNRLTDPSFVQQVQQLHAAQTPLVQMVEVLGLGPLSPTLSSILAGLGPEQIAGVRRATLNALTQPAPVMPVDCNVPQQQVDAGELVSIEVPQDLIVVRPVV